ncbi:MAG: hypothetical protein JWP97_5877 [Labilithrix sp.]|nr:hypothetical protein [Labilithrix sp.]
MKLVVLALATIASLAVTGCRGSDKQQAAQVSEAMDRFRKAPNAAKPDLVAPLRAVPCRAPDVCRARDACLVSAEATARALVLKNEVERAIADLDAGKLAKESAEAQALGTKLGESSRLLDEGFAGLASCDDQVMALRRTYQF